MSNEEEKTIGGLIIAVGTLVAIFVPGVASFFAPYLLPALFFLVVFSLVPYAGHKLSELSRLHPVVPVLVFWQQLLLPALAFVVGRMIGLDHHYLFLMLVILASGSLFASPTLVQLMGLNHRIAMQTVVVSTFVAPLSILIPFWLYNDSNTEIHFDMLAGRIALFVIIPLVMMLLLRLVVAGKEGVRARLDRVGRWGSIAALLIFCFAIEEKVAIAVVEDPERVARYLFLSITVAGLSMMLTRVLMSRYKSDIALTVSILASFRNVGLTYGLVAGSVDYDLSVFVGVCQIPMFFAPFLFDLIFGSGRKGSSTSENGGEEADLVDDGHDAPGFAFWNKGPGGAMGPAAGRSGPITNGSAATASRYQVSGDKFSGAVTASRGGAAVALQHAEPEAIEFEQPVEVTEPLSEQERMRVQIERLGAVREDTQKHLDDLKEELEGASLSKRYIACLLALALAGIVAVWQGNKFFYPMLFDQGLIEEVADAHIAGRNFAVFDLNINIRDLRNAYIERMPKAPDVAVLGASHWQEAHVNLVRGKDFYNSHVHRDYYEDMLAVTEMYLRHGKMPKEMIITIRDNLLTPIPERTDFLWLPGIKYYRAMADRLGLEAHSRWATLPVQTWRELASLPLLLSQAYTQLTASQQPHATDERNFDGLDTLLPGGSILWSGEHQRLFTLERARREALAFAEAKRDNPPIIDPKGVEHIEALLTFLTEQGVKVTLAHPQFNPIFWDAVQGSAYVDGLQKVEEQTRRWADQFGLNIIGGFAPDKVGCTADMYIDAEHGNPTCLGRLLEQYNQLDDPFALRGSLS